MSTFIVHVRSDLDLATTANRIFPALLISSYEQRYSDNYPKGTYLLGCLGELEIILSYEDPDDPAFADYQYTVDLSLPSSSTFPIDDAAEAMILELLRAGFGAAREIGFTERTVEREIYSLGPNGELRRTRDVIPYEE